MLFKIKKDVPLFELNPEMGVIEEFAKLTEKQMMVVILVADFKSPLRSLPERVRREKACMIAGYTFEDDRLNRNAREIVYGKVASVEKAVAKYKELQFDETRDEIEAVDAQIDEAKRMMRLDKFEACKIEKIVTRNDGTQIKTSYVDNVQAVKLAAEAMKLGARLTELKETKEMLMSKVQKDETPLELTTYTAADILPSEDEAGLSVLDLFNKKKMDTHDSAQ